jgi:hypothetical protein
MQIGLTQEEKVRLLVSLSGKVGLTEDEILALFLVLGDGIFFLFDLLQDHTLRVPSLRSFRNGVAAVGRYRINKMTKDRYVVNGVEAGVGSIKSGDVVHVGGSDLVAMGGSRCILGDTYILFKCKE